jgi:hypothetical protein
MKSKQSHSTPFIKNGTTKNTQNKHTLLIAETSLQKSEKFLLNDLTASFLKNPNKASSNSMFLALHSKSCTQEEQHKIIYFTRKHMIEITHYVKKSTQRESSHRRRWIHCLPHYSQY